MDSVRPLTIGDLLGSPALGLRLIAGAAGLDRRVSWAHVSELDDPTPWLLGSELIMTTGIGVPRGEAAQRAYLERLDAAGVAGLALSAKLHVPPLHRAFLDAAEQRSFPVLEVPLPVPFIAIAQTVAAAVQAETRESLSAQLSVFGSLRWLTSEGLGIPEIFERLETLSGFTLYLCTADGAPLLPGVAVPPPDIAPLIPETADGPPTMPGGYVLPVSAPDGPAGFVLALRRPDVAAAGLAVVQHIATVASLQLAIVRHGQEIVRREGAETLAELLGGLFDERAARRRLARLGFAADQPLQLVVLRGLAGDDERLVDQLSHSGMPHLVLRQEQQILVLLPEDPSARRLVESVPGVHAGASRGFQAGAGMDIPRREALWAAARAEDAGSGFVRYGADAASRWLADDPAALRALSADVLDAARAYDAGHRSELVATVRTWLERDRHNESAAFALGIHPNTLSYRLRRFEQLSGRNLGSTADLAEVWLALRADEQLSGGG
ncbi:MAG: PucR family transcriptional regulator ligand-binding domain-containing protein [Chloroflexota bacterium]